MVKISILLAILAIFGQTLAEDTDKCGSKLDCRSCTQSKNCAWCFQPNFAGPRCFKSNKNVNKCNEKFIQNLKNEETVVKNEKFSGGKDGEGIIQMKPQNFSLKLRVGK